jgi:hypothetical protein
MVSLDTFPEKESVFKEDIVFAEYVQKKTGYHLQQ